MTNYNNEASLCSTARFGGGTSLNRPVRIQTLVSKASWIVSASNELRKSWQMRRDLEKMRSTDTLVAGMARKSLAMQASVGNELSCV